MRQAWLPTLFLLAAICLLPAWVVGGFALGAGLALWGSQKWQRARIARARAAAAERALKRTARQVELGYKPSYGSNVVPISKGRKR